MQTAWRVLMSSLGGCVILPGLLWAGLSGPVPISVVARQADVIAIATLDSVTPGTRSLVYAQLRITRTIKGQSVPSFLTAELVPSQMMSTWARQPEDLVPKNLIGTTGLWFLKEDHGSYRLLPLGTGDFIWEEVFMPLPSSELPDPATVIPGLSASGNATSQIIWAALVTSYLSSLNADGSLRDLVLVSLDPQMAHLDKPEDRQDAIAAANALIASKSTGHHIIGMAAACRVGDDRAIKLLIQEAPVLHSHKMFPIITTFLLTEYQPDGEASIPWLRSLIGLHVNGVNFDLAAVSWLRKIGTKAVLPIMAELLDSDDTTVQLHAAATFGEFTLFANANGNVPALGPGEGHTVGPWATPATRSHMPARDSGLTAQDYASFWKSWWVANRAKLGF